MKLELWLAFVATYSVISIILGPSVFMVTGQALTRGAKAAFLCILGELAGGIILVALSLFGVGAILAASSELFQIVKWAGVFYMAFLSQFLDPNGNIYTQFAIVVATSTVIVGIVLGGYALPAAQARKTFQSAKVRRRFGYTGDGFFIGGSVFMASTR